MENKELILKALDCYKKHKECNLKNSLKNERTDIAKKLHYEIREIDYQIELIRNPNYGKADH